jgi:hypothetical protein
MPKEQLTPQDAAMFEHLYVPAFVKRCQANGVNIPDENCLKQALETTAYVLQHAQEKQGSVIERANASIKAALGVHKKEAQLNEHNERLKHAFQCGQNPEVRSAILSSIARS